MCFTQRVWLGLKLARFDILIFWASQFKEWVISVTRWLDYLFKIWPFTTMKICPITSKTARKVDSKFCPIVLDSLKNCLRLKNCKSGEISPIVVTLWLIYLEYSAYHWRDREKKIWQNEHFQKWKNFLQFNILPFLAQQLPFRLTHPKFYFIR